MTSLSKSISRQLEELSDSEQKLVEIIAEHESTQSEDIYEVFHECTDLCITRYSKMVNKLDQLCIIDAPKTDVDDYEGSQDISLEYEAEAILNRL